MAEPERWYWDLTKQRAVPASQRSKGDDTLGPYGSRVEAENWRATVEARNDTWDDADDDWDDDDPAAPDAGAPGDGAPG